MLKLSHTYKRFQELLFKPVDPGSLAIFRILFGIILAYHAFKDANMTVMNYSYVQPKVHFTFALFDYLNLPWLTGEQLLLIVKLTGVAATWIALGLYFRFALVIFILSLGYQLILDKAYYNNHIYLILLIAFLLNFMGSTRSLSIDALRNPPTSPPKIPFWNIFLLRAQLCIVYFFAALPKLYPDYLGGRQMSVWLIKQDKLHLLHTFVPMDLAVIFFTYASLFFDLLIGLLLCYKPTRVFAIILAVPFHLLNAHLFPIGIFPYLMIASLILFVDPDTPKIYWQKIVSFVHGKNCPRATHPDPSPPQGSLRNIKGTMTLIMLYLLIQILIPLRHFLIPGNVNWTKEGIRFSWMLMANVVHGTINIVAVNKANNENIPIDVAEDINFDQFTDLVTTPDMIHQYAQFLKKRLQAQGIDDPAIYIDISLSINGRRHRPYIKSDVDLADTEYQFMKGADWILPPPDDM